MERAFVLFGLGRAGGVAAGGNASVAEPTKVEVAERIGNWFGAGARATRARAAVRAARRSAAWHGSGGGRSVSRRYGGGELGSDK